MADKQLGSASVGMEIDLKDLQAQLNQAARMIGDVQEKANKQAGKSAPKGGLFGSIISGSGEAASAMGSLGSGRGISGITSALGGLRGAFAGVATAGAGSAAAMTGVGLAIGAVALVVGGAILSFFALKGAITGAFAALQSAGNLQATETTFEILRQNMGVTTEATNQYREALEKMNYVGAEQTQIMSGLLRSNVGLNDTTLEAVGAMRDLSVAAGVASTEGIGTMNQAITTLNPQLLQNYGLTETATQVFDQYGATIGKSATQMSNTEKRQAILNAVILKGAQAAGAADAAQGDLNRSVVQLQANFETLKAGIGQVFLPLASGIVSMINTEIFGLSKTVDANRGRFESMGAAISNKVLPMVRGLITWIKNIPWTGVISGIARIIAATSLWARIQMIPFKIIWQGLRIIGTGLATAITLVERSAAGWSMLGKIAGAAWQALTGQIGIAEMASNMRTAVTNFTTETSHIIGALGSTWGELFGDIGEDWSGTIDGIIKDANLLANGFDIGKWFTELPNEMKKAGDGAVQEAANTGEGISAAGLKALKNMQEDLAKENAEFARRQADALRDYEESIAEAVTAHRNQISSIRKDIAKEQKAYEKAYSERTREYQDELSKLNKADDDRKKDINTQIAEELAKGRFADQTKLASLRSRLAYEDAAHKTAVQQADSAYKEDTTNAKTSHEERIAELQTNLDKELEIQRKHQTDVNTYRDYQAKDDITKLKEQHARRKAEDARAHKERLADIIKQGTESASQANQNGMNEGSAMMHGLGAGITGNMGIPKSAANKAGKGVGDSTSDGIDSKTGKNERTFSDMLKDVAAGAAVGSIFGPVGALIGGAIGGAIPGTAKSIGSALKTTFEKAKGFIGDLGRWGKDIVGKMGEGIAGAWGKAKQGFIDGWKAAGLPGFASGGIIGGRHGTDTNIARVSRGEMILNADQQQRMFNMLDGRVDPSSTGGSSGIIINELHLSLPAVRNATDFERELKHKFTVMRTT